MCRQHKRYTKEEIDHIIEYWGVSSLSSLAKRLNRSEAGVREKALTIGLGKAMEAGEYLTASEVARIIGASHFRILTLIRKKKLRAVYRYLGRSKTRGNWRISVYDLIKFLKECPDEYNACKIEKYAIGYEPKWLVKMRDKHKYKSINSNKLWKQEETDTLINLYYSDYTIEKLAKIFDRSRRSIERKLERSIKERCYVTK